MEAEEKSPLAEGLAEIYEYSQAAKTAPEEEEPESIIKKKNQNLKRTANQTPSKLCLEGVPFDMSAVKTAFR